MTQEQILEILDSYKLRIPPTVFYDLKADIVNYEEQEPTTKNDLAQERYQDLIEYFGDEKVAKIILESRKEFKAWLERLRWHVKRADELARELELLKGTTKNNLGVDCISREQAKVAIRDKFKDLPSRVEINTILNELPSVTPQEPKTGHWIRISPAEIYECSECGQNIMTSDICAYKFCHGCGAKMESEE